MPKSKLRPRAVEKKKAAAKHAAKNVASKKEPTNSGNPGGKTYYGHSLAGAVKMGSPTKTPSFHNRKGGGE
jgi:hypothetical protein